MKAPKLFKKRRKKFENRAKINILSSIVLFIVFVTVSSSSASSEAKLFQPDSASSVSTAIVDFIREFYIANNIDFEFIILGKRTNHIGDVINEVTRRLSEDRAAIVIRHFIDINDWNHTTSQSFIIFIDSKRNLEILHQISTIFNQFKSSQLTNIAPKRLKFLVYCEEIKSIERLKYVLTPYGEFHFNYPPDLRFFEFFIIDEYKDVRLVANLLYSDDHCELFKLKTLNTFHKKSQKWSKKLENFDHFANFHGCILKFFTFKSACFYISHFADDTEYKTLRDNRKLEFGGMLNDIVNSISHNLNFTPYYTFITRSANKKEKFISTHANLLPSLSVSIPYLLSPFNLTDPSHYPSLPSGGIDLYFLVTRNGYYTNYEKMSKPFDELTWALLLFTFGLTFGVIFGLRFSPQWLRTIIFGEGKQFLS
jgi:uncharacterized membrane protein (DUF485 family)